VLVARSMGSVLLEPPSSSLLGELDSKLELEEDDEEPDWMEEQANNT